MKTWRGLPRATIVQLALFLVVAVACTAYVGVRVFGSTSLAGGFLVTVRMADTGGLTPASQVTYRGVPVGKVEQTKVRPGLAGVEITLRIRDGVSVPASASAVVSMETPMAIQKLDLRPADDRPPYLAEGSEIASEATSRPVPLETLLTHFLTLADSIDPADLATLSREMSAGLTGTTADLERLLGNAGKLVDAMAQGRPSIVNLTGNAASLLDVAKGHSGTLGRTTESLRQLTGELRGQLPAANTALDTAVPLAEKVAPLLRQAQPSVSTLLANLASGSQILVTRTPALNELLVAVPATLDELASIEHGGVAHFYLVAAQGPACYYGTERRPVTDPAPRAPETGWACPGDQPGLQQRGAANAPRPAAVTTYDPATRRAVTPAGPVELGVNGGQAAVLGPRSWSALLLQGAQGKGS
ncbi:MlaD family protein [Amycolatopsis albispora]|uniref:Uncharacterized protein n=1 Tax=Amycolatopsis albispora TaxID=1804986 RepID=A0A344L523_9PSEU|nr:MlaD family protein [Amycolatopsis albispora]AXB43147.1 hypothetical protein A4R43_11780 [Amycolatopsis albispora]